MSSDEQLYLPNPHDSERHDDPAAEAANNSGDTPPADEPSSGARGTSRERPRKRRRKRSAKKTPYPSEKKCLAALARLAGLVVARILTPSQANVIRATFSELLRWHQSQRRETEQRRVGDADLLGLLRKNPELLDLLEPLLTDDQIEMLSRAAGEEQPDGET